MRYGPRLSALLVLVLSCATPPAPPPAAPPAPAPAALPAPETIQAPAGEFKVSAEKKNASLKEIRELVDKLNALIARRAFDDWKTYLDDDYIALYGGKVKLKEFSRPPYVRKGDPPLGSLKDFFDRVVVLSRAEVPVDDISFVDENRVKVLTVIDGDKVVLYLLKLYGKEWKISSW